MCRQKWALLIKETFDSSDCVKPSVRQCSFSKIAYLESLEEVALIEHNNCQAVLLALCV